MRRQLAAGVPRGAGVITERQPIPVLVVNLDTDKDRLSDITAQISQFPGFALHRIRGVPGGTLSQLACDILTRTQDYAVGNGVLGVFLAHLAVWEHAAGLAAPFCLVIEDDVELVDLGRLTTFDLPQAIDLVFCNNQMQPTGTEPAGPLRIIGIGESLRALTQAGSLAVGAYGYLLTPVGARKLVAAIKKDLCFGHVDWRLLRYCVTPELVDAAVPGTRVAEVLRNHHHRQRPAWNVLSACTLIPALALHVWTPSRREEQNMIGVQSTGDDGTASVVLDGTASVVFDGRTTVFHLTNKLDHVQSFLARGVFYEARQLQFHRDLIPMGGTVVDVGAYIGTHTLFYAQHTWAKLIYTIEPNPFAREVLLRNIAANGDYRAEIRTDHAELAVGAQAGWYCVIPAVANNRGATALRLAAPTEPGALRCMPLDDLAFEGRVTFLKIDTEGMEIEVLSGASRLITAHRPVIAVEVLERNEPAFRQWLEQADYQIIQAFWPYLGTRDFVILPRS
jgi:FkbM family methyltransferase